VYSPRRGSLKSAPGNARGPLQRIRPSPERAQHRQPLVAPFQGLFSAGIPSPRALPGADLFGPFGAKSKIAQHQNLRVGLVRGAGSRRLNRPRGSPDPAGLVTRRPRGARRGSPDPAGLPDRQVSRAHRRPRFQRCSCLLSLLQTKETYRSSIWAGSGDPRPARVRA
jgi:hypothetical protein